MVLDDEKKKEIGKRIQKTRKELGFKNGHAFYDFVFGDGEIKTDNKKDSVISEWENGKKYIDLDHLMLAADKLGVSLDYLVYGNGEEEHALTFREICENVARFFFLAKAEIVQEGDNIGMMFHERQINEWVLCLTDAAIIDENSGEDSLSRYARQLCEDLRMVRILDNKELSDLSDEEHKFNESLPFDYNNCPISIFHSYDTNDLSFMHSNNLLCTFPYCAPYTETAKEYLTKSLLKYPQCSPQIILKEELSGLIQMEHEFRDALKEKEKAAGEKSDEIDV